MSPRKNKTKQNISNQDEDYVSMENVKELMEQQKLFYVEMLNRQESNFMSFTKMIMESTTTRIDGIMKEVHEVKSSLQFSQAQIDDLRVMEKKLGSFESQLQSLQSLPTQCMTPQSKDIISKIDYLENQSRRNNVIIDGLIQENAYESWSDTEQMVREFLKNKLKIDPKSIEIERAHRTGSVKQNTGKTRPIVVKFLRYKDKDLILAKARAHLKNTLIYVNEDFSDLLRKKRADLIPAMKQARDEGKYAVINYDRLVIKPRKPQGMIPTSQHE